MYPIIQIFHGKYSKKLIVFYHQVTTAISNASKITIDPFHTSPYNIVCVTLIFKGGAIALMDMNPRSTYFQKFAANPFAFTAFKSTG